MENLASGMADLKVMTIIISALAAAAVGIIIYINGYRNALIDADENNSTLLGETSRTTVKTDFILFGLRYLLTLAYPGATIALIYMFDSEEPEVPSLLSEGFGIFLVIAAASVIALIAKALLNTKAIQLIAACTEDMEYKKTRIKYQRLGVLLEILPGLAMIWVGYHYSLVGALVGLVIFLGLFSTGFRGDGNIPMVTQIHYK